MQVHTAQLAGGDNNADRVFVTDNAVVVLDGASAFEPVDVDPGTYADTLGMAIAEQLDGCANRSLTRIVAEAIRLSVLRLDLRAGCSPSSTVSILRTFRGAVDLYVLGDSPVFYGANSSAYRFEDLRLAKVAPAERAAYVDQLRAGSGYGESHRRAMRALQRAQLTQRNVAGGYWIAEREPVAASHGLTRRLTPGELSWAVIATDGVTDVLDHLGHPAWATIARYDRRALTDLLKYIHRWEDLEDPAGQAVPRAKRHDDKSIVTVSVE